VTGKLGGGVYAKDVILAIIRRLGVKGGIGYAYEYGGPVIDAMTVEERLTVCNMSIEGGARVGYVNPDETVFDFLRGREYAPKGEAWDRALGWWRSMASDPGAPFDDRVELEGGKIEPTVTWGINPGQACGVNEPLPRPEAVPDAERASVAEALAFMELQAGEPVAGTPIDVVTIPYRVMREVVVEPGRSYFDTNTEDHHHFFVVDTGELRDIHADSLQIAALPEAPEGTAFDRVDVIVRVRTGNR